MTDPVDRPALTDEQREAYLAGYEFALRNLTDEAVQADLHRLTDEQLAEVERLRGYRDEWELNCRNWQRRAEQAERERDEQIAKVLRLDAEFQTLAEQSREDAARLADMRALGDRAIDAEAAARTRVAEARAEQAERERDEARTLAEARRLDVIAVEKRRREAEGWYAAAERQVRDREAAALRTAANEIEAILAQFPNLTDKRRERNLLRSTIHGFRERAAALSGVSGPTTGERFFINTAADGDTQLSVTVDNGQDYRAVAYKCELDDETWGAILAAIGRPTTEGASG